MAKLAKVPKQRGNGGELWSSAAIFAGWGPSSIQALRLVEAIDMTDEVVRTVAGH